MTLSYSPLLAHLVPDNAWCSIKSENADYPKSFRCLLVYNFLSSESRQLERRLAYRPTMSQTVGSNQKRCLRNSEWISLDLFRWEEAKLDKQANKVKKPIDLKAMTKRAWMAFSQANCDIVSILLVMLCKNGFTKVFIENFFTHFERLIRLNFSSTRSF